MRLWLLWKVVILVSLLNLISTSINGAEFSQGVTKLSNNLKDGTPVEIEVRTSKIAASYPYKDAFMWGGDMRSEEDVVMPKTVISMIDVRIGNRKSIVPLSAYSDLGAPFQISYEKAGSGFKLIIRGRERTGTSYKATLEFNSMDIRRRTVVLAVFPDEVWEETTYSFK